MEDIDTEVKNLPSVVQVMIEASKALENTDLNFVHDLYFLRDKTLLNTYLRLRGVQGLDFGEFVVDLVHKLFRSHKLQKEDINEYIDILSLFFEDEAFEYLMNRYDISLASIMKYGRLPVLIRTFEQKYDKLVEDIEKLRYVNNYIYLSTKLGRLDFLDYLLHKYLNPDYIDHNKLIGYARNKETVDYLNKFFHTD